MFKISGAKLFSYDLRDYSLMSFMDKKGALRRKDLKLSDDFSGVKLSEELTGSKEYKVYLTDDGVRHLTISEKKELKGKKEVSVFTIGELGSKETVEVKKLGKVPVEFKKGLITDSFGETVYYVSSSKVGSKQVHIDEELNPKTFGSTPGGVPLKAQLNFVVNKAISDKDFATEKWLKIAAKGEAKVKEVSARTKTMFKVGDKASTKVLFTKKESATGSSTSTYAAILIVDPIKGSREILTFGDHKAEAPTVNVEDHTHILVESDEGLVGFVSNIFKNMLFLSTKLVPKGTSGPNKAGIIAKELRKLAKGLVVNKEFVGIAASV